MTETTHKLQVAISALILIMATATFFFGPGILLKLSNQNAQTSSTIPTVSGVGSSQNYLSPMSNQSSAAAINLILGRWSRDPDPDNPDVIENWTFYKDGAFSVMHDTVDKTSPPIVDQGAWDYVGNNSYLITVNGERIDVSWNGSVLLNVEEQSTFHRLAT
ncbi:MAG: hypothetical protein WCE46_02190 [Methanoregula sp.]|jgi:hypothetical protein|uniref:hypothetical protein n=1 Tax=Methanoregula sp. TaxID=2052170 RepID=UPI003C7515D5